MNYIEIKAPAKINIGLFVTSKRADGYHNIETLFYPLNYLYDKLTFTRSDSFSFFCSESTIDNSDNLIVKAKDLLEKISGKKLNVQITLEKRIPMGAGLGGGSSDAAAALLCLNEMFRLNLNSDQLKSIALEIGSDVPFFIKPKPSIARSRGEELTIIDFEINLPILIVNPGIHISTKEAYQNVKPRESENHLADLNIGRFNKEISDFLVNDFEEYVFSLYPQVAEVKKQLIKAGALYSLMSGSGSSVYGIFPDINSAEIAQALFPHHYFTFINYDPPEL